MPSIEQLKRAITLAEQIETLQAELNQIISGVSGKVSTVATTLKAKAKKVISPAARAKMVAGIKARWAKIKAAKAPTPAKAPKKKGGMSAAGRAAIVAAQKARWAKVNAAKKTPAKAPAPKPEAKPVKKRKISPAARKKMSEAAKARWAQQKVATDIAFAAAITPMV
ncbi:MAG: histone [Chthoniobacteraceae bacterium]